jgi:hypothetical protein
VVCPYCILPPCIERMRNAVQKPKAAVKLEFRRKHRLYTAGQLCHSVLRAYLIIFITHYTKINYAVSAEAWVKTGHR